MEYGEGRVIKWIEIVCFYFWVFNLFCLGC